MVESKNLIQKYDSGKILIPNIQTYNKDKRKSIQYMYKSFLRLDKELWREDTIYNQIFNYKDKRIKLPIIAYKTRKKGKSLWIIAGVHGEEPAGPNAITENINFLNGLAKKIPLILIPLANPKGYFRNWRYINIKRSKKNKIAKSIGDSEHLLIDEYNRQRAKKPSSRDAEKLTDYIFKTSKTYPPLLELDFHEDESRGKLYIYSQGKLKSSDPIANEIVSILKKAGFKFYNDGKTRFNQQIKNGIVSGVLDGSIDELISSEKIFMDGKIIKGPSAKSVVVIETTTINIPLSKRVKTHSRILRNSEKFYSIAKRL